MTNEEIQKSFSNAAAVVKLVCGVGNNAAWLVALEAHDHAKQHYRYFQSIKGGSVRGEFKRAFNAFKEYERGLKHASKNRMFCLADMREDVRRKYGDITDAEFYGFWKGIGGPAYQKTRPLITSLWNKYRISLVKHNIRDAEHLAWVMVAQAAIDLAGSMYESAMQECETGYKLPRHLLNEVFSQFSLKKVSKLWFRAMMALEPATEPLKLDSTEEKNIDMGLRQLMEAWLDPELLYSSTSATVEDYDEIFATKGFQKKVLKEIADVMAETMANIEND